MIFYLYLVMEDLMERITIDPTICGGKPIISGKRITVQTILGFLRSGDTKQTNWNNTHHWMNRT